LHQLGAQLNAVSHDSPVGAGFCLYLRRDRLREVGDLDATVIGKGYHR
jgi:hypothetical protein